jgi:hypothetical protein
LFVVAGAAAGSINFENVGEREPQTILKTDERRTVLELAREGKFTAKSGGWDEDRVFLEGDKLEVAVKNGRWVAHAPARRPATGGRTAPMPFSGRLKRRCNGGDTVTETGVATVVTPLQRALVSAHLRPRSRVPQ